MNFDKVHIACSQCGGWHLLKELVAVDGRTDISYICPKPQPGPFMHVSIAFELKT